MRARKLMSGAGFTKANPLKTTFMVPTGGSGQMLSMPINEFIQQGWTEIGLQVAFQPVELEVAYTAWRKGAADPSLKGITASNIAYVTSDPFYALIRFYSSRQIAPVGVNWSGYRNPEVDALCDQVTASFDPAGAGPAVRTYPREGGRRRGAGSGWCTTPIRTRCRPR